MTEQSNWDQHDKSDVEFAREVLETEAQAIRHVQDRIGSPLRQVVERMLSCEGRVVVTGMGKAGIIARKISATLSSTGTPSWFIHPAEAYHGDLGRVMSEDLALMLSNSGETEELVRLVEPLKEVGTYIMSITSSTENTLGSLSDLVLEIGDLQEACPLGLAPSSSSTAMLALGDAISLTVLRKRDFDREEYARYHPGGALGRELMKVQEIMRVDEENPVVSETVPVQQALIKISRARAGAISLTGENGKLTGIFTDGDLRRLVESNRDHFAETPVREVMTESPFTVQEDQLAAEAGRLMREKKIDEVPVVNDNGEPVGLLDIQDLLEAGLISSSS